jgi:hypothetical protein
MKMLEEMPKKGAKSRKSETKKVIRKKESEIEAENDEANSGVSQLYLDLLSLFNVLQNSFRHLG